MARQAAASGTHLKGDIVAARKTKPAPVGAEDFVKAIGDETRRDDCLTLIALMKTITKCEPKMWGSTIVGFGDHHDQYGSGHEGDTFILDFSPRKDSRTLDLGPNTDRFRETLDQLGKHKVGKWYLYVRRPAGVNPSALSTLLKKAVANLLNSAGSAHGRVGMVGRTRASIRYAMAALRLNGSGSMLSSCRVGDEEIAMTTLLRQAFAEASKLREVEQDVLASRLLAELAAEEAFDRAIPGSTDNLSRLAREALTEHRSGLTEELDPDRL
jgi:hypothetical protein